VVQLSGDARTGGERILRFFKLVRWRVAASLTGRRFDETAWYPLGRVVGGTVYPVRDFPLGNPDDQHAAGHYGDGWSDPLHLELAQLYR
jgi:hypothetical protein